MAINRANGGITGVSNKTSGGGNTIIVGSSSIHYTGVTFIRLGDT